VPSVSEYDNYGISPYFNYYVDRGCFAENVVSYRGTCEGVEYGAGLLIITPDVTDETLTTISVSLQEKSFTGISGQQEKTLEEPTFDFETQPFFSGTATVTTDKTSYEFGEPFDISGKLSQPDRGLRVNVIITDPFGRLVLQVKLVTTTYGVFQTPAAGIASYHPEGLYTISVYNNQGQFLSEAKFTVGSQGSSLPDYKEFPKSQFETLETFRDDILGFSIKYPSGWEVDDEAIELLPFPGQHAGGISPVAFYNDIDYWDYSVSVSFLENDVTAQNYRGQQYLGELTRILREDCQAANFEEWGYTCSNHVVIDSQIIEIDGKTAYQVTESWIQTYDDYSTYRNLSIMTDIPVGSNVWIVDTINTASEYPKMASTIDRVINSFDIFDSEIPLFESIDVVPPLIMTPSDMTVEADDQYGAIVDYSVKAIDDVDGVIRVFCTPSSSSYFLIGKTIVTCITSDSAGNSVEKSFKIIVQTSSIIIPDWIKSVAAFWCNDEIEDASFVEAIQYLINNKVIIVQATTSGSVIDSEIPEWIKNNACWWSDGLISDEDFASGLQYLIGQGIIRV